MSMGLAPFLRGCVGCVGPAGCLLRAIWERLRGVVDLAASRAKLAWAGKHLRTLQSELPVIREHDPASFRVSEIDEDTGWCEVHGRLVEVEETTIELIVGDYLQNLRAALDYTITALVRADNGNVSTKQQFPIYERARDYRREVGSRTRALSKGPLRDVKRGLDVVWDFQPHRDKTKPYSHPLSLLNRFSNTDKHEHPLSVVGIPVPGHEPQMSVKFARGTVIERWQSTAFRLATSEDTKLAAFRFAKPFPGKVDVDVGLWIEPMLSCKPFPPRYKLGSRISVQVLEGMHACVGAVLDRAESA